MNAVCILPSLQLQRVFAPTETPVLLAAETNLAKKYGLVRNRPVVDARSESRGDG